MLARGWAEGVVEHWRKRLVPEWELTVDWQEVAGDDRHAEVTYHHDHRVATVTFPRDWKRRTAEQVERTVVHEVVHLLLRDVSTLASRVIEALPQAERTWVAADWEHAEEEAVDRIAGLLFATAGIERYIPGQ